MLDEAGAWPACTARSTGFDPDDVADLAVRAARAREIVYDAGLPDDLASKSSPATEPGCERVRRGLRVAVRSSATAEDLPTASFAGQHETYLDVARRGGAARRGPPCFASLFTDRGVHYRVDQGFDQFKVALSVGVMKMVRADLAAPGSCSPSTPSPGSATWSS